PPSSSTPPPPFKSFKTDLTPLMSFIFVIASMRRRRCSQSNTVKAKAGIQQQTRERKLNLVVAVEREKES
ncbi:hypothetical protein A2U01_0091450, partial [Trifolium medium]|nr:hypothetical protein [Trifolium medium]